jgi:hypothetical protein
LELVHYRCTEEIEVLPGWFFKAKPKACDKQCARSKTGMIMVTLLQLISIRQLFLKTMIAGSYSGDHHHSHKKMGTIVLIKETKWIDTQVPAGGSTFILCVN